MAQHAYGMKPSVKDVRDYRLPEYMKVEVFPPSVDLRRYCSPIRDQGNLGSCTAFAIGAGMREFMMNVAKQTWVKLSPQFLYWEERKLEDSIWEDSGAMPKDGFRVLTNIGICDEVLDVYNVERFTKAPSIKAICEAKKHKIVSYHAVNGLTEMKQVLVAGEGVVIGVDVFESFEAEDVAKTGNVPVPKAGEMLLGGHALFVCGYVDSQAWGGGGYWIVRNSWGEGWGFHGYCYMPYAYPIGEGWTAL